VVAVEDMLESHPSVRTASTPRNPLVDNRIAT
jgi:hypothetical protein